MADDNRLMLDALKDQEAMQPETYVNPVANALFHSGVNALLAPGRALQSTEPLTSEQMIAPAADMASMMTLGAGAAPASANELRMGIKAYHGSPHSFDRFDINKIGTGEGAQAYGHGLYFAENPAIGEGYAKKLGKPTIEGQKFDPFNPMHNAIDYLHNVHKGDIVKALENSAYDLKNYTKDYDHAMNMYHSTPDTRVNTLASYKADAEAAALMRDQYKALHDILSSGNVKPFDPLRGHRYEVDINANPENLLHWDRPLSEQQHILERLHPGVKDAIETASEYGGNNSLFEAPEAYSGRDLYHQLKHHDIHEALPAEVGNSSWYFGDTTPAKHTSQYLNSLEVPGIQFLDANSRKVGQGTHNIVTFRDDIVNILRKYGIAGVPAAGLAGAGGDNNGR